MEHVAIDDSRFRRRFAEVARRFAEYRGVEGKRDNSTEDWRFAPTFLANPSTLFVQLVWSFREVSAQFDGDRGDATTKVNVPESFRRPGSNVPSRRRRRGAVVPSAGGLRAS